jgi:nucleoside-diphosphate-sugar epimerase
VTKLKKINMVIGMKRINKIIINENSPLREVMKTIDASGYDFFIVTNQNGVLKGVVTEGDIRRGILDGAILSEPISKVMNNNPVIIKKGNESELLALFKTENVVGKIPIVDKDLKVLDLAIDHPLSEYTLFNAEEPEHNNGKILVIGGAGYIGSMLVRKLLRRNYRVKVLDALLYGDDSIRDLYLDKSFEFVKGDTRHVEVLTSVMSDVTAVVHLAELVGDPLCDQDAKKTRDINMFATSLVAQVCKQFLIPRFVYVSSCSVYGANKDKNLVSEKSPPAPVSLYAKMKLESEKALTLLSDDVFNPTILRLATVYGLGYRPRFDLVVNTMTAHAYHTGKLTVHGGGTQYRPLVHVSDVAEAIIKVLEAPKTKVRGEVFNVGCEPQNIQIKGIAKLVKQVLPKTKIVMERDAMDKRDYRVCFEKIRNVLGWNPQKDIKQGIYELKKAFDEGRIGDYKDSKYRNFVAK